MGTPYNIPKASLVTWMAILGRLNTGDRLKMFGITQTSECVLCNAPNKDHNHLFFDCPFSFRVWECIKAKRNMNWPNLSWPAIVNLVSKSVGGTSLSAIITRLAFTYTVYQLWIVRNNRVFRNDLLPIGVVTKCIVDMVRFRMMPITNLKLHPSDCRFLS